MKQRDLLQTGNLGLDALRDAANGIFTQLYERLEVLESGCTVVPLEDVTIETGAAVSPTDPPFSASSGRVRVTCPFTPKGLVLLRIERLFPAGDYTGTTASDVKWHYAAGPQAGDGAVFIDFVTGLTTNSRFRMRLGAIRG